MHRSPTRALAAIVLSIAVGWGVAGCATEENGGPSGAGAAVIGNWNVTTFTVNSVDIIAAGMSMIFTFENTGDYTFTVTNDQSGSVCDTGLDCFEQGDFTATATQITLDPGTTDATVLNYSISGNTMTITATIDGTLFTLTLDRF